ncbi:hypothetical protein LA76x_0204 [Lysobacter antibioticus]|uniref:Uncharacterized protein n=1 Tax=Lysobacter antibioticus TaxID=84531 RepID=A0A0S2F4A8_LYSAN|nr:hypothetical protein LA76x_0204 [Lysobacter antibioticus]
MSLHSGGAARTHRTTRKSRANVTAIGFDWRMFGTWIERASRVCA